MNKQNTLEDFGQVIYAYTRAQAIQDGVLVDVTPTPEYRELRFNFPVAFTQAVWGAYVEVPAGVDGQDLNGRLWDILWMFRQAIQRGRGENPMEFQLHVRNDNRQGTPPLVTLKAVCGPGDDAEPVLTIMTPDED